MFGIGQANDMSGYAQRHGWMNPHGAYQAARKGIDTTGDRRLGPAIKELLGLSGTQIILKDEGCASGKAPAWYSEPEIYMFLCKLLEGIPVRIEKEEIARTKASKIAQAKETVLTWAPLEGADNIGKIIPRAGKLGRGLSLSLTPPLMFVQTIGSIKEISEKKNTILIRRENYTKALPLLWILKTNTEKNLTQATNLLFMGSIDFWKERYGTQIAELAKQQFQEDLRAAIKERNAQGWIKDMQAAKRDMLAYNPDDFPPAYRQAFIKEIEGFKKWLDWSYAYAFHAFVEKDPKMRERTQKLWEYLCREYMGATHPERYIEKAKTADKTGIGKAMAVLRTETAKEIAVLGASLGWTAVLFMWTPWGSASTGLQMVLNLASYAAFDLV